MKSRLLALTCALATVVACSDSTTPTLGEGELSSQELETLFTQMGAALAAVGTGISGSPNAPSGIYADPIPFDFSINTTVPCATGTTSFVGTTSGTVDDVTAALDLTLDFAWGFNSCVADTSTEIVYTLDSAPGIAYVADVLSDPTAGTISTTGSQTGGIRIQTSDGRDVTCIFDVNYSATTNTLTSAVTSTVTGTVCGVDVNSISSFTVYTG